MKTNFEIVEEIETLAKKQQKPCPEQGFFVGLTGIARTAIIWA